MSVLAGIPGHGKTSLINDVACSLAALHDWVTVFFSPEQPAATVHLRRLLHWRLGRPPLSCTQEEVDKAREWVSAHFAWMISNLETDPTVDWYIEMMEGAAVRHNASLAVIDPWNEMDHTWRPEGISTTEYVGEMIKRLRRGARHYGLHLIISAHPTKGIVFAGGGRGKDGEISPPTGYDIADSAHFVNKADLGLTIHRRKDGTTMIRNWKTRYEGEHGKQGEVIVKWSAYHERFECIDEPEPKPMI
jgi:twinkle protein